MSHRNWSRRKFLGVLPAAAVGLTAPFRQALAGNSAEPLTLIVMDPLAKPLSCPCVKGYAQRDYDQLAKFLSRRLKRPVEVHYSESLLQALELKTGGAADLVIGKDSVVRQESRRGAIPLEPVAQLTGKDGKTTQTGLIVVPAKDPAQSVADLKGYRIVFGPEECDEKHAAILALLKKHDVPAPAEIESCTSCSDGATMILEAGPDVRGAAVISSYAQPLLEGCGTVKKGDLRVVGETEPVPFVSAFLRSTLETAVREQLEAALLEVGDEVRLCQQIETRRGFVAYPKPTVSVETSTAKKKN